MLQPNTLHEKLQRDQATVGTHFLCSDPDIPELIGDTRLFDYAEFCAEYSTFDMRTLYDLARSAQCGNLPLMIKLDQPSQEFWAQAAIGAGFHAVLFTDIRSPADIDACYRCIRPDNPTAGGNMGVKLRRNALSGYESGDYLSHLESIIFSVMIEKQIAVDNLNSVLRRARERGVMFTQWGPADLAFSMGNPGLQKSKEIQQMEERFIKTSLEFGVQPRVEIASPDQAPRYLDLGVKHFCIGWDRSIYQSALREIGSGIRDLLP